MRLLPRFTTCNAVMVKENNGKAYSTGYYDTHVKPLKCCEKSPDIYARQKTDGFLLGSEYEFRCSKCKRLSGRCITANSAAAAWNRIAAPSGL